MLARHDTGRSGASCLAVKTQPHFVGQVLEKRANVRQKRPNTEVKETFVRLALQTLPDFVRVDAPAG